MDKIVSKLSSGLRGEVVIPSDKSISHRSVMFASLAKGESVIRNFSNGADCISSMKLFKQLGVDIEYVDEKTLNVNSSGILQNPNSNLDCGNSGTTMRLCSGILASQNFDSILFGDESLSKRPMKRVIEPLSLMGAEILSNDFKAPLKIKGHTLKSIKYNTPIASAQVKSCILLAGLNTDGITTVEEPYLSRNHTELLLKYMGANIEANDNIVSISKSELRPCKIDIAGDISSAAFFIVAGLVIPNSEIIIRSLKNPTCIDVSNEDKTIKYTISKELGIEIVGDAKIRIPVSNTEEDYDLIIDEDAVNDEIEKNVNINYLDNKDS